MSKIVIRCPRCDRRIGVPNVYLGRWINCPNCQMQFAAMAASAPAPPTESAQKSPPARSHWLVLTWALAGATFVCAAFVIIIAVMLAGTPDTQSQAMREPVRLPTVEYRPHFPQRHSFDEWVQDLDIAKGLAAEGDKDILALFDGSDWSPASMELARDVFLRPEFLGPAQREFVLVYIDFPRTSVGESRVEDTRRNERLQAYFDIQGYPTAVLTDAEGRPYAWCDPQGGDARRYVDYLANARTVREQRDHLFDAVAGAKGAAKLTAAKEAVAFLKKHEIVKFYGPLLDEWTQLARAQDPRNDEGNAEFFFEYAWAAKVGHLARTTREASDLVARLDEWDKTLHFKDVNRGARVHLIAGMVLRELGKVEEAKKYFEAGLEYKPTDASLLSRLAAGAVQHNNNNGSGFVVAPGYVMTNEHVVHGPGRVACRLSGITKLVPAQVVAQDEGRDIALLRLESSDAAGAGPLNVVGREASPGEMVLAFGYPFGESFGSHVKLTTGTISGTPEPANGNLLLLEAKVNPGNSGGPLCDAAGNVIGMVSRKSKSSARVESFGFALPSQDLDQFLQKNLSGYKPAAGQRNKLSADEVYRRVSPSVLMVVKERASE